MPCKRKRKPKFKNKTDAERHGYIQYGAYKDGSRKFTVRKLKNGWSVSKKKRRRKRKR